MTMNALRETIATYDAIHAAIRQDADLAIIYATDGTTIKERTIRPLRIEVGKKGSDLVIAHDSLRNGVITFRVDRVVAISGNVPMGARS